MSAPSRDPSPPALTLVRGGGDLARRLRAGDQSAKLEFFNEYAKMVQRVLVRTLGSDQELGDLVHDVFIEAFRSIDGLKDLEALGSWLRSIAYRVARDRIRRRRRRRWLSFVAPEEIPERAHPGVAPEVWQALRAAYDVLDRMPADDRMVFILRHVERLTLEEITEVLKTSFSTARRRLDRAQQRFARHAAENPTLADWLRKPEGAA